MKLNLRSFVGNHPHGARLRKRRDRVLRAVRPSRSAELNYRVRLNGILALLRPIGQNILDEVRPYFDARAAHVIDAAAHDDDPDPKKAAVARGRGRFDRDSKTRVQARAWAGDAAASVMADVNARIATVIAQSLRVDVAPVFEHQPLSDAMQEAISDNVELITSIPEQYFDLIDEALDKAWDGGWAHDKLADRILEIGDITENRAALIARDQVSKMNSAFNREQQTELGIKRYEWQTAGDDRVRDSHADLDGQVFEWDDPPDVDGENVNPGDAINCRCVAAPVVDLDEEDDIQSAAGALQPDEFDLEEEAA